MAAVNESLAGMGEISIVPSGSYPDPVHLVNVESIDWSYDEETAELENADGYVIDSFTTKTGMSGTITFKDLPSSLLAQAVRGATVAAGSLVGYAQTTVIPTTPFVITVTNGATFATDLGVINLTTGTAMTCAATAAAGSYSLNTTTGAYTFDTSDAGDTVLINYRATQASTGSTATVAAVAASASTYFGLHCYKTINGRSWGLFVPKAKLYGLSGKLSKKAYGDFSVKFTATLDDSGNLSYHYK